MPKQTGHSCISTGAEFFALQSYQVSDFWPQIRPLLSRVKRRDWDHESIETMLTSAQAQCWGLIKGGAIFGVIITRIENIGSRKRCLVWIAAGEGLSRGRELLSGVIEPWAKANGCEYMQINGRKGWLRALPDYSQTAIVMEKRL